MYARQMRKVELDRLLGAISLVLLTGSGLVGHRPALPTDYFDPPLATELVLAGNFAEMRSNHFHAGLDFKTRGREGLPVFSAAEGWISRVKVSPFGYGNALYVQHPNGYTTVYAHLQRFEEPVASYVRELQYKRERFDIDVYPREGEFPVERRQQIALSGNSGGSYAPHLHFEIRETASQTPVNPLLFDFDVDDSLPPRIFRIKVYPEDGGSYVRVGGSVNEADFATAGDPLVLDVSSGKGAPQYQLVTDAKLSGHGAVSFGIQTNDYHDGSNNRLGAYRITLEANGTPLFVSTMDRVRFDQTRYINAHVDYAEYKQNRRWIQRSHTLPGNRLPLYEVVEAGRLRLHADSTYHMRYSVEDASGNTSVLEFELHGEPKSQWLSDNEQAPPVVIPRREPFVFARNQLRVKFDANTFYDDQPFSYEMLPAVDGALSPVHRVHEDIAPLHKRMTLSIRARSVPPALLDKTLLGTHTNDGDVVSAGGGYRNGFVAGRLRSFGDYFIVADTVAPEIELLEARHDRLRLKVRDDLSGVAGFNARIDGNWVLLEYDAKNSLLVHNSPDTLSGELEVVVEDNKGNTASLTRSLDY